MRGAAARDGRRRISVHRIGRMLGAVIRNDRRAIVIGAEVETRAGILLDVDFIGATADLRPSIPRPRFHRVPSNAGEFSASACDIAKRETWLVIGQRSAS